MNVKKHDAVGQGTSRVLTRDVLRFSITVFLQAQSRTASLFTFLTVTVLPNLIKLLRREINLKIVRNSIMGDINTSIYKK